jgi:hypothetical protein
MTNMTKKTLLKKINTDLHKLTSNKYFPEIPLKSIDTILTHYGLNKLEDGIYTGQSGEFVENVGKTWGNNVYLRMTWYRMESGRYEIVAYVS